MAGRCFIELGGPTGPSRSWRVCSIAMTSDARESALYSSWLAEAMAGDVDRRLAQRRVVHWRTPAQRPPPMRDNGWVSIVPTNVEREMVFSLLQSASEGRLGLE